MNVIALIPFRNEARYLPVCLASLKGVADMIIGLDDDSSDDSAAIVRGHGGIVLSLADGVSGFSQGKEIVIRQRLLDEGRRRGGTHFMCIDADEALTAPFRTYGRALMEKLGPGQKLALPWLTLWGSPRHYRDGDLSKFHRIYRAVIVRDAPDLPPYQGFLHMPRTPGSDARGNVTKVLTSRGALLHYTAADLDGYKYKIAWYHCVELVRDPSGSERINRFYFRDWDETHLKLKAVPEAWLEGLPAPGQGAGQDVSWHHAEIIRLFDSHGIVFFEPLEIWHVPGLRDEFVRRTGREPRATPLLTRLRRTVRFERKRFDRWLIDIKRALRNEAY